MMVRMLSEIDSLSIIVTPRILIDLTRGIPRIGCGKLNWMFVFNLDLVKIISADFEGLRQRLLAAAHLGTCSISATLVDAYLPATIE